MTEQNSTTTPPSDPVIVAELDIPVGVGAPGWADFASATRLLGDVEAAIIGTRDRGYEPEEYLPTFGDPHSPQRMLVARRGENIIGVGGYELQIGESENSAWVSAQVLPEFRHAGVGAALFDEVVALATADGHTVLQSYTMASTTPGGERLPSPTGFGSVPLDDDSSRFMLARGFRLAQVARLSRLTLPCAATDLPATPGYDLESWTGATPEHRLSDMAVLHVKMSTDPPVGETDYQPEAWDEERVRQSDARHASDGRLWLTTAVRHVATDTLVGFTEIVAPRDSTRPAHQIDTIVAAEHRGHRLGLLLKLANLRRLAELSPGHPAIYTWNAEENRPMLDVNEAVGFVAAGYEGSWRRDGSKIEKAAL